MENMKTVGNGRYQLEKKIGKGGFGTTYKALDTNINTNVAIKEFICKSSDELDKALNEARIAAGFYDLEGIASARDFFEEAGNAYIVMEYVHGISIKRYISDNGKMNGRQVLSKLKPIMNSLAKIHEKGVLHRDISADNLMITDSGKLMLVDFGAAKTFSDPNSDVETKTITFKRGFTPIEQCLEYGKQGTWTDVYSLCATIYFMITGIIPYDSIERSINDKLTPLGQVYGTGLVPHEENAIMKGLSVEANDRFSSIWDLYEAIYNDDLHSKNEELDIHTEQLKTMNTTALRSQVNELFSKGGTPIKNPAQTAPAIDGDNKAINNGKASPTDDNNKAPVADNVNPSFTKSNGRTKKIIIITSAAVLICAVGIFAWITSGNNESNNKNIPDTSHGSTVVESINPATYTVSPETSQPSAGSDDDASGNLSGANSSGNDTSNNDASSDYVKMPALKGLKLKNARKKIHKIFGPYVNIITYMKYNNKYTKNYVVKQNIKGGKKISLNEKVQIKLIVSKGSKPVIAPSNSTNTTTNSSTSTNTSSSSSKTSSGSSNKSTGSSSKKTDSSVSFDGSI